jgi:hypothetical protein
MAGVLRCRTRERERSPHLVADFSADVDSVLVARAEAAVPPSPRQGVIERAAVPFRRSSSRLLRNPGCDS